MKQDFICRQGYSKENENKKPLKTVQRPLSYLFLLIQILSYSETHFNVILSSIIELSNKLSASVQQKLSRKQFQR